MIAMKKILINISLILGVAALFSCEKDETRVVLKQPVPANELTSLSSDSIVLTREQASDVFQTFTWSDVNYGINVVKTYKVQIDTAGNNFANPSDVTTVTQLLTSSISVADFNKMLLNKGYTPEVPASLEFRVASIINNEVVNVYSNVETAVITPYALSYPPIFMCGAATGGWDWNHGVEVRSSAPNVFQTIAYFLKDQTFRFFAQPDWGPTSYNYPYFTGGVDASLINADDGDKNFKVTTADGYYSITANLNAKTVTFELVDEPVMFMTGAALGGWDWTTNYVQMTWVSNGKFEATTDFLNGETFRFFAQKDWSPVSYNFPYFAGGSVDPLFENANDGDKNFRFVGTTGSYKITLNMLDNTVVMEAQ
jgi:starch-binding outer membrane protein SusE/F